MAAPRGTGRPWWSLGVLPAVLLLFGAPCSWTRTVAPLAVRAIGPDGRVAAEGFAFERQQEGTPSERGVALPPQLVLEVELPEPTEVSGLVLQANHNDAFRVSAAGADGIGLGEVWVAPRVEPPQLRTRRSPRLALSAPVLRLRIASLRGRPYAVSDLSVRSPRFSLPAWTWALALWIAWLGLRRLGREAWLARWRRADLRLAVLLAGLAVPGLAAPALMALAVDAGIRGTMRRAGRSGLPAEARAWGAAGLLVLLAVAAVYVGLITRGGEGLDGGELLGAAYDSLADSLTTGDTGVERWAIRWEAFDVERGVTTYFGPLPALLRIPAHWLAPTFYGRWSRISCLSAAMLALWACAALLRGQIERNEHLGPATRRALLAIGVLGVGLGSPLAFMLSAGSIYHEAPLWALASSLWGVHFALALAREPAKPARPFAALSVCAGAALLSRVTFGLPLLAVLGVAALTILARARREGNPSLARRLRQLAVASVPALGMVAFQLWYNHDRFGSIWTFIDWSGLGYLAADESSWRILQESGTFHPARIPGAALSYFGFRADSLSGAFPFFQMLRPLHLRPDLYPPLFVDYGISLSLSCGWLLVGAALGCVALVRRREPALARWLVAALAGQMLLVLSYYIVSHRYALDFLPFLVCATSFFFADLGRRLRPQRVVEALGAAVLFAAVATTLSTLSWIPLSAQSTPRAYKQRILDGFDAANTWLGLQGGEAAAQRAEGERSSGTQGGEAAAQRASEP